jgi:hypothetical protein
MRDNNDEFTFCAPNPQLHILWWTISRSRKEQRKQEKWIPIQHRISWGLIIDFGMSFIPTSMLLPSSLARNGRYARCNTFTSMSCKIRKSLSSTLPSVSVIGLSYQISCLLGMIGMRRS